MSKWKSVLPVVIVFLIGVGTYNVADSIRGGFRPDSMAVGCSVLAIVFFLYTIWRERATVMASK